MEPLKNLNTYFNNMDTIYDGSSWANCATQAELNHELIRALTPDNSQFVTKVVFDTVSTVVNVALEDWPAAIGSVFSVITDLYHLIAGSKANFVETKNFTPILDRLDALAAALQDLNTRVNTLEKQNQNQNQNR